MTYVTDREWVWRHAFSYADYYITTNQAVNYANYYVKLIDWEDMDRDYPEHPDVFLEWRKTNGL